MYEWSDRESRHGRLSREGNGRESRVATEIQLYGGSGFREKTLRWEIATAGCRSREIGDMPWEGMRERKAANRTRKPGSEIGNTPWREPGG